MHGPGIAIELSENDWKLIMDALMAAREGTLGGAHSSYRSLTLMEEIRSKLPLHYVCNWE